MPGATPLYGLPYQLLSDAPDGPELGQDLAEAVEDALAAAADPPVLRLRRNATQSMANGGTTAITWDTVVENKGFTYAAPNSNIVIPRSGWYACVLALAIDNSATAGFMQMSLGATALARVPFQGFNPTDITGSIEMRFNAGNTVSASVFHNNGAARNVYGGTTHETALSLRWVRS